VRNYLIVTFAYWVFTLTDGALRMLVLLHLHAQGYTPITLASIFLLYEFFGITTNFTAGWVGARFGLKSTLWSGLSLQILATSVFAWQAASLTVPLVIAMQGLSGIAKDLTKMSAKSYVRLLVPLGQTSEADQARSLLHWVAVLTGSKNTLKGIGFFLGGFLLSNWGFQASNLIMVGALLIALLVSSWQLPAALGKTAVIPRLRDVLRTDRRVFHLSWSRLFLFGARDAWFAIGLPIFLVDQLNWSQAAVGAFLAAWVIGYGLVQASAPRLLGIQRRADAGALIRWTLVLLLPILGLGAFLLAGPDPAWLASGLVLGLAVFGILFAGNSALHSFLILHLSEDETVSLRVGFYYMANAMGRFCGVLASGVAYQWGGGGSSGLLACLGVTFGFLLVSSLGARALQSNSSLDAA
jgi:MFS transporter, APGE family, 1-arseno-3-phosphoglycerate exporter